MAKILIVDDEPDIVRLVERYAVREGYEVTGVGDGTAAIEACRREVGATDGGGNLTSSAVLEYNTRPR